MNRLKRRALLRRLIRLGVVITLGLGAAGFYAFFLRPQAILDRAEQVLFRRASVTFVSEERGDRYFFVSNRLTDPALPPLENALSQARAPALTYGSYVSRLDPGLTVQRILDVANWFDRISVLEAGTLPRDRFLADLRDMTGRAPLRSVLVIVQGLHSELPSVMRNSAFMARQLDIDTPMVLFDWPANQGRSLADYRRAVDIAGQSGADLADLLALIAREVRPERIWVMSNSLGSEVVTAAMTALLARPDFADAVPEIEDVVLIAPDSNLEVFLAVARDRITTVARRLTVYVSGNDKALAVSRLVNFGARRVGQSTLALDDAKRLTEALSPAGQTVSFVDVTPVNRANNFHDFGFEAPEFYDDLFLRLTNHDVPASRRLHAVRAADGRIYWVLSRN